MDQALIPWVVYGDEPALLHPGEVDCSVGPIRLPQQPRRLGGHRRLSGPTGPVISRTGTEVAIGIPVVAAIFVPAASMMAICQPTRVRSERPPIAGDQRSIVVVWIGTRSACLTDPNDEAISGIVCTRKA